MTKTKFTACLLVAALGVSACAAPSQTLKPTSLRNAVQVAESIERLELYTRPNGMELSARDTLAVEQFLDGYSRSGDGPLYISRPSSALSGLGTKQAEATIRGLMAKRGLNPMAVQTGQHNSKPGDPAPVLVSYRALRAIPQDCRSMGNLTNTYSNQPHSGFGCFQSANLAAMVTDPRQLLEPYTNGQPNAQRRQVIYDRYIEGTVTAAAINPEQKVGQQD